MVSRAMNVAKSEEKVGNDVCIINARFLKPLDKESILKRLKQSNKVIIIEDGTRINGLSTAVKEIIAEEKMLLDVETQAYPDEFIQHGTVEQLEKIYLEGAKNNG